MKRREQLPAGVTMKTNGRFVVQVPRCVGGSPITRTYKTKAEALAGHARGHAAKDAGTDVAAAMDATSGFLDEGRRELTKTVRLFGELIDEYLDHRRDLVAIGNHERRRSLTKGWNSFRPTSLDTLEDSIRLHIRPYFAHLRIDLIESNVVHDWTVALATKSESSCALEWSTSNSLLITLTAIMKRAKNHELPEKFPWLDVAPISPSEPRRPRSDPSMWGGQLGDPDPVLEHVDMARLAMRMAAADRVVHYCEYLGGPRIGEIYGLRLKDLRYFKGRLRVRIARQGLHDGQIVEWVKSDPSRRTIPLEGILAEYLDMYCLRYHGYDLHNPDRSKGDRLLVVNPSGRDLDGTFLPGRRAGWCSRLITFRSAAELGFDDIGYDLTSHSNRRSLSTYLFVAEEIIASIENETDAEEGPRSADEEIEYWKARANRSQRLHLGYFDMHISAYLGHDYNGRLDPRSASAVTITKYKLKTSLQTAFDAIADVIDLIARDSLGSLLDEPDESDLLPVHGTDDPEWVTATAAAPLLGIDRSNVISNFHAGHLEGHFGWLADGGWRRNEDLDVTVPTLRHLFISRASLEARIAHREKFTMKRAARRLGMTSTTVISNFVSTGELALVDGRLEPAEVIKLRDTFHTAVLDTIACIGPASPAQLKRAMDEGYGRLFVQNRCLRAWIDEWVRCLVKDRRLVVRLDGRIALPPASRTSTSRKSEDGSTMPVTADLAATTVPAGEGPGAASGNPCALDEVA